MGVSTDKVKIRFDLTIPFPTDYVIDFPYWNKSEIYAVLSYADGDGDPLDLDVDYSLTTPNGLNGTLSRVTAWTDALAVTIFRSTPITQESDPTNGDKIDAEVTEMTLDKLTAIALEQKEQLARALVLPITDPESPGNLPSSNGRANTYLGFDGDGKFIASAGSAGGYPVTAFAATILDDANLLAAQKTLEIVPDDSIVGVSEQAKAFMETGSAAEVYYDDSAADLSAASVQAAIAWFAAQQKAKVEAAGWTWNPADPLLLAKAERTVAFPLGTNLDIAGKHTVDWKFPAVLVSDADHILDVANYPLYVPWLRAQLAEVWNGSSMVTEFSVTIASGVATGSGTAWDGLLTALAEESAVHGGVASWRGITIKATDVTYAMSAVAPGSHTCTLSSPPADGSYTVQFHPHRIAGSATTARTYKDNGRAIMSADGITKIVGLRRRNRFQSHGHASGTGNGGVASSGFASNYANANQGIYTNMVLYPVEYGGGTPRYGNDTESDSSVHNRYQWAGIVL